MNSFYSAEELQEFGFRELGKDVLVSRKASIYGASKISIGDCSRIDDFCILSGNITIGRYIHISAYTGLFAGDAGIVVGDYAGISSRCAVYAVSDDYSGDFMTNATVPEAFRNVYSAEVRLGKHSLVGSGCTVLPGVTVGEGASVGAMSFVNRDVPEWTINIGVPCRVLKERSRELLKYETRMKEL